MAATGMMPSTYGLIVWRLWLAGAAISYGAWSAVVRRL